MVIVQVFIEPDALFGRQVTKDSSSNALQLLAHSKFFLTGIGFPNFYLFLTRSPAFSVAFAKDIIPYVATGPE